MDPHDNARVHAFYNTLIEEYGPTVHALGWNDEMGQQERFRVLCSIGDLNGKSVLDVGCGLENLYTFLGERYKGFTYQGVDINPHMIELARLQHSDVHFEVADFGDFAAEPFDYVLSSGALTFKIANHTEVYFGSIRKMYELSTIGVAFNVLSAKHSPGDDTYATYSVHELYDFCSQFCEKLVVREDYLEQDLTMYLYR